MVAEIIVVPDTPEALESVKRSARHAAQTLSAAGIKLHKQISICSGKADLQKAVALALSRSNITLTLGGLSKESGRLAKTAVAQGLNLPVEHDGTCFAAVREYCLRSGDPLLPGDADLAMLPRGSVFFRNRYGKTPGIAVSSSNQHLVMLPAGEKEAVSIIKESVLPYITDSEASVVRVLRTYGVSEDSVRRTLREMLGSANPAVTIHREGDEVLVRVAGRGSSPQQAASVCTPALRSAARLLGDAAYGLDVESLQAAVVDKLRKKQLGLAVAESGSEGMLTRVLSETESGTQVLRYNVFADDSESKRSRLSIPPKRLKKHGEVSEQIAVLMANAAREKSGAELAAAITMGTGQSKQTPTGLVYIAVCDENSVYVKKLVVGSGQPGERNLVLDAALSRALNMLRLFVDYLPERYAGAIPLEEALSGKTVTGAPGRGEYPEQPEKKAGFLGFLHYCFIINRADKPGVKMRKVVFILALLIFLGSAGYAGKFYYDSMAAKKLALELKDLYANELPASSLPDDYPSGYIPGFAALYSKNTDVVAYVKIRATPLEYPVVQSGDNEYYMRRNFNKERSDHGVPFMDWRVDVKRPSDNMVIYGHNMKDGQIFGELMKYNVKSKEYGDEKALAYYREHPVIDLATIFEENRYKIFSVFITNAYKHQGPVFDYHNFINASSDGDFASYVKELKTRSLINTGVDVAPGDKLITLSTCTYEFTDARFVVVARKLRPGEDENADPSAALNPQPLMPDIWYQTFGGSRPESLGDASVITTPAATPPPLSPAQPQPVSSLLFSTQASSLSPWPVSMAAAQISAAPSAEVSEPLPAADSLAASEPLPAAESPAEVSEPLSSAAESPAEVSEPLPAAESPAEVSEPLSSAAESPAASKAISGSSSPVNSEKSGPEPDSSDVSHELLITANNRRISGDALDIVSRMVQNEIGSSFHDEAIKAQAVAAYTYISYHNQSGTAPQVSIADSAERKVRNLVSEVLGEAVYYKGSLAFTPYHAISAGSTTSSKDVWGGAYPYLTSVDSAVDSNVKNYEVKVTLTSEQVAANLESKLGVVPSGDPESWIAIRSYTEGGYVGDVRVCGETTSPKTGAKLTGRLLRESVFGLRSACFEIDYDSYRDRFTFTTYGYGHGVGLSQNGANQYAMEGLDYIDILTHYYSGTEVR